MVSLEFAMRIYIKVRRYSKLSNSAVLLGHHHFLLQHAKELLVVYAVPQF
jgi:hypothetical protein